MKIALFALLPFVSLAVASGAGGRVERGAGAAEEPIAFQEGMIKDAGLGLITAMTFGPDGRLYVASLSSVSALTLDESGTHVTDKQDIAIGLNYVLGLAFDPTATPSAMKLYVSGTDPDPNHWMFPGVIRRFTAPNWDAEDVITGLPQGHEHWHYTNGLAFDAEGKLYIGQGSTTEQGVGEDTPLGGAVLVADVNAPGFDGHVVYDPPDTISNQVDQMSGDVHVFAPGFRNPYGLVMHSNGYLYATDNAAGGPPVALSCQQINTTASASSADEVNLVEEDHYYGIPNPNRGRFDQRQCVYRYPEERSTSEYTAPLSTACHTCESVTEYASDAFNGAMKGDLVSTQLWSGGVWRVDLSEDGRTALSTTRLWAANAALGIAVGPTGIIYFGGSAGIIYLQPSDASAPTATPSEVPTVTLSPTSLPTGTPTPPPQMPGDVDCNRVVDSRDAALILQLGAGLIGGLACPDSGDVDGDKSVGSLDALLVLQCAAGLIECESLT